MACGGSKVQGSKVQGQTGGELARFKNPQNVEMKRLTFALDLRSPGSHQLFSEGVDGQIIELRIFITSRAFPQQTKTPPLPACPAL